MGVDSLIALAAGTDWARIQIAAGGDHVHHDQLHGGTAVQPSSMSPAQLAAVSFLARYSGATHTLYVAQLRRWFTWCVTNGLDPLVAIQRAHVEL